VSVKFANDPPKCFYSKNV